MLFNSRSETQFGLVDEKQAFFHDLMREKQIQDYKKNLRYQLLINYTCPEITIQRIETVLLSPTQEQPTSQKIIQIIWMCRSVRNNYKHCALLSNQHILEKIIIAITTNQNISQLGTITQWLKLVLDTLYNWPSLWSDFYSQFDSILWGIIADFHSSNEIILLCCEISKQLKQKCRLKLQLNKDKINLMFSVNDLSPFIFRILPETMDREYSLRTTSTTPYRYSTTRLLQKPFLSRRSLRVFGEDWLPPYQNP